MTKDKDFDPKSEVTRLGKFTGEDDLKPEGRKTADANRKALAEASKDKSAARKDGLLL